ncbi:MAG TPA: c-type cytochrome [Pelobium sp.]
MKILKFTGIVLSVIVLIAITGGLYINFALPNIGVAENIKVTPTARRLERGKYLANHVAACMDCHSQRDWNLYAGPMVEGTLGSGGELFDEKMGFPGKIYAPNITPHALANWTDGEIIRAITTGESKDGRALFPLMAYSRFGKMDKEDVLSIVAYLRSIDPIANEVPQTSLNFPVNLINNTLPKQADFQKIPAEKDSVNYGAYLVNMAGCVDCHSKTDKGQVIAGTEFGGGMEFKFPDGTLTSPNITMHKNGIGNWSKDVFVQRFKMYSDSAYKAENTGLSVNNSPMPWSMYAGMKPKDLEAIYAYLRSVKPQANQVNKRIYN